MLHSTKSVSPISVGQFIESFALKCNKPNLIHLNRSISTVNVYRHDYIYVTVYIVCFFINNYFIIFYLYTYQIVSDTND